MRGLEHVLTVDVAGNGLTRGSIGRRLNTLQPTALEVDAELVRENVAEATD
jgi:hypothetical protein